MITAAVVLLALGVVFIALRGCTLMPWAGGGRETGVSVSITREFGQTVIESQDVTVRDGDSVMDVLKSVADVETEYGGGFVSSIEGLRSGRGAGGGNDWFYYVNGVLAGVGSAEYEVGDGDRLWWDYHLWNSENFTPAVVGAYPAPFTRGYSRDTASTVLYGPGLESAAREIGGFLEGKGAAVRYLETLEKGDVTGVEGPAIAVLSTTQAAGLEWISNLLTGSGGSATFLALDEDRLVPLDGAGKPAAAEEEIVAAVVATGSGMGDARPVWLVLCAGEAGAAQAVRVMAAEPEALSLKAQVAVGSSGTVYRLPGQVKE